jgi:hypothetical protein
MGREASDPYSCIQICMKCHAARAAVAVVLAVDMGFWDAKTPGSVVAFTTDEADSGVTCHGIVVSSTVPLMSVSYEKPVCTGWSM